MRPMKGTAEAERFTRPIRAEALQACQLRMYEAGWSPRRVDRIIEEAMRDLESKDTERKKKGE